MRIIAKIALYATVSGLAATFAPVARADMFYQPYYYERENLQFAHVDVVTPPQAGNPVLHENDYRFARTGNSVAVPVAPPIKVAPPQQYSEGIQAIRNSDSAAWISTGATYLNYKEALTPMTDGERGWMPSFAVGASYMTPSNWYFAAEGGVSFGDAPYNGALEDINTGVETPFKTWTHETNASFNGKFGKGFAISDRSMLTPYGELGLRYWDRNIRGPYPGVEDYSTYDSLAGLMLQIAPTDRLILSAYGSYGLTFANKMYTQDTTVHLGSAGMYKIGGKVSYAVTRRIDLFTTMDFDHFRNVNSGWEPDYEIMHYIMEPSSYTNEMTTRMGVAYRFQ